MKLDMKKFENNKQQAKSNVSETKTQTVEEIRKTFADNREGISQGLEINGEGFFCLKDVKLSTYGKNNENIRMAGQLMDKTGAIDMSFFGVYENQKDYYKGLNGTIVQANYRINSYKEKPQVMLNWIRPAKQGMYDVSNFLTRSSREPEEMYQEVLDCAQYIGKELNNPGLCELITTIYEENKQNLLFYPAAKSVHEAYVGGLLTHMTNMLSYAKGIADVNPIIRKDLLYTGIVLHDIEKITEFELDQFGNVTRYSDKGNMFGHLYMGAHLVQNKIDEINAKHGEKVICDEDAMRLVHMILSHHGKPEYDAVKMPATVEAMVLYQVDTLDSQLEQMYDFYNDPSVKKGQTADEKVFTLGVRPYRPFEL